MEGTLCPISYRVLFGQQLTFLLLFYHAFHLGHLTADIFSPGTGRLDFQIILPSLNGSFDVPLVMQKNDPQIVTAVRMLGVDLRRLLELSDGPVIIALSPVHDPQVSAYVGIIGVDLQGFGISLYSPIELSGVEISIPKLDERVEVFGVVLENGSKKVDLLLSIRRWGSRSR